VQVVEETIRYIDELHRMLAKRVQADDTSKLRHTFSFIIPASIILYKRLSVPAFGGGEQGLRLGPRACGASRWCR